MSRVPSIGPDQDPSVTIGPPGPGCQRERWDGAPSGLGECSRRRRHRRRHHHVPEPGAIRCRQSDCLASHPAVRRSGQTAPHGIPRSSPENAGRRLHPLIRSGGGPTPRRSPACRATPRRWGPSGPPGGCGHGSSRCAKAQSSREGGDTVSPGAPARTACSLFRFRGGVDSAFRHIGTFRSPRKDCTSWKGDPLHGAQVAVRREPAGVAPGDLPPLGAGYRSDLQQEG